MYRKSLCFVHKSASLVPGIQNMLCNQDFDSKFCFIFARLNNPVGMKQFNFIT
jgi:hypothetical protein